jgi:hypothetical protein
MRVRAVRLLATVCAFSQSISLLIFTLACSLATILASAQTVPLTATVTRIRYTISADGGITLSQEERGSFSRTSDGDEATHVQVVKNGQFAPGTSRRGGREVSVYTGGDPHYRRYQVCGRASAGWQDRPDHRQRMDFA